MAESYQELLDRSIGFFSELKANNTREWFADHKATYEAEIKRPAQLLADDIAARLTKELGRPVSSKLYRINRDVRFSKDKSPYNCHLHLLWSLEQGANYFLGISPSYVSLGAGYYVFEKAFLERYRMRVAGPEGEALADIIDALVADGHRLDEPPLKRVPSGFDKDHPRGDLLRRKGLALWRDGRERIDEVGLVAASMETFATMRALTDWLDKT